MKYSYACKNCDNEIIIENEVSKRNEYNGECEVCKKNIWNRNFSHKILSSKIIGAMNASKRDGVGVMIDEQGHVCPAKTRGHIDDRKKQWKQDK